MLRVAEWQPFNILKITAVQIKPIFGEKGQFSLHFRRVFKYLKVRLVFFGFKIFQKIPKFTTPDVIKKLAPFQGPIYNRPELASMGIEVAQWVLF
jgi:hypothetical protein